MNATFVKNKPRIGTWILILLVGMVLLSVMPAYATDNPGDGWFVRYYNNPSLEGEPVYAAAVDWIGGNWGFGPPHYLAPADRFSARWTGAPYLEAGLYRLTVRADDGVRVRIDGDLMLDEWHLSPYTLYTQDIELEFTGQHEFIIEYYENEYSAALSFDFVRIAPQPQPQPPVTHPPSQTVGNYVVNTAPGIALNLRIQPTVKSPSLKKLARGTVVNVLSEQRYFADGFPWLSVEVNGIFGFAAEKVSTRQTLVPLVPSHPSYPSYPSYPAPSPPSPPYVPDPIPGGGQVTNLTLTTIFIQNNLVTLAIRADTVEGIGCTLTSAYEQKPILGTIPTNYSRVFSVNVNTNGDAIWIDCENSDALYVTI